MKFGVVVSPLAQEEKRVVAGVFAELVGVGVYAVFEGPRGDAFGGDEKRGQVSLGFFVIDTEELLNHR